jgi:hypothetical protein
MVMGILAVMAVFGNGNRPQNWYADRNYETCNLKLEL